MDTAKLIADLIAGEWGLEELAERHDITLEELARFAASGETLRRLAALRQLADAQTQLTLSKHRQFAVAKLYELAQGDGETARKACVDLMKLDVKNAPTAAVRPPEPNAWDDPLEGGPGDEADEPVVMSIAEAAAFANRQWESRKTSRARGRAHRAARAPFASGEFTDRTPAPPRPPDWGGWPGSAADERRTVPAHAVAGDERSGVARSPPRADA